MLGNLELEAFDAGAGWWFLAQGFPVGAIELLGASEDAGEGLLAEMRGARGVGGEADEGVARGADRRAKCESDGLRRTAAAGKGDVGGGAVELRADAELRDKLVTGCRVQRSGAGDRGELRPARCICRRARKLWETGGGPGNIPGQGWTTEATIGSREITVPLNSSIRTAGCG